MWFDDNVIRKTVNRDFMLAQLKGDERATLDEPFQRGKKSAPKDTYLTRIESNASRLFLILTDLGLSSHIFRLLDGDWDDEDLPVPIDLINCLNLTTGPDAAFEKSFYLQQFHYLLRYIEYGRHGVYSPEELVPMDMIDRRGSNIVANGNRGLVKGSSMFDRPWSKAPEKVCCANRASEILYRKSVPIGEGPGCIMEDDFLETLDLLFDIRHKHIVSLWGSYSHLEVGHILLAPVIDTTFRSALNSSPPAFKALAKEERRTILLRWMHCLGDALALLHDRGVSHGFIKPSSISIDDRHEIFLSSHGRYSEKPLVPGFDQDQYDYSPAEALVTRTTSPTISRSSTAASMVTTSDLPSPTRSGFDSASLLTTSTSSRESTSSQNIQPSGFAADVFSLGCIFLEIITMLTKKTSKNFAAHRSAKNKSPGRGGAVPDASFHKNLGQVKSWIASLAKELGKKDDAMLLGVPAILHLVTEMISPDPALRPSALRVRDRIGSILGKTAGFPSCCGLARPNWDALPESIRLKRLTSACDGPGDHALSRTPTISSISTAATITGSGQPIHIRRYASGGGRTAPPRRKDPRFKEALREAREAKEREKMWAASQLATVDENVDEKTGVANQLSGSLQQPDVEVGSMYELRLYDFEQGGSITKVGWECL